MKTVYFMKNVFILHKDTRVFRQLRPQPGPKPPLANTNKAEEDLHHSDRTAVTDGLVSPRSELSHFLSRQREEELLVHTAASYDITLEYTTMESVVYTLWAVLFYRPQTYMGRLRAAGHRLPEGCWFSWWDVTMGFHYAEPQHTANTEITAVVPTQSQQPLIGGQRSVCRRNGGSQTAFVETIMSE